EHDRQEAGLEARTRGRGRRRETERHGDERSRHGCFAFGVAPTRSCFDVSDNRPPTSSHATVTFAPCGSVPGPGMQRLPPAENVYVVWFGAGRAHAMPVSPTCTT